MQTTSLGTYGETVYATTIVTFILKFLAVFDFFSVMITAFLLLRDRSIVATQQHTIITHTFPAVIILPVLEFSSVVVPTTLLLLRTHMVI